MKQKQRVVATDSDMTIEEYRYNQKKIKAHITRSNQASAKLAPPTLPSGTVEWIEYIDSRRREGVYNKKGTEQKK